MSFEINNCYPGGGVFVSSSSSLRKPFYVLFYSTVFCMLATSGALARDEITCPSGTASGSTCWKCGDNCTATLTGGKMTVSGTGAMYDFGSKSASGTPSWVPDTPWANRRLDITSIEIGDNITKVGNFAFPLSYNLTDLKLGKSVENLGGYSFCSSSANEVKIPASVTEIGGYAFHGGSFSQVTFESNKNLKTIGNGAFADSALTSIDIPDSVESIGNDAFWGCTSLTSVHLPDNLKTLGTKVFEYAGVTVLEFPAGITNIPDRTCAYCSNLKKVIIDGDNISVYYNAFHYSDVTDIESKEAVKNTLLSYFSSQLGRNVTWNEYFEQKPKRTFYTPAEAAQHLNHTNNNDVIFTFK